MTVKDIIYIIIYVVFCAPALTFSVLILINVIKDLLRRLFE